MVKVYKLNAINPVTEVIEVKVIDSHRREEDKKRKKKKSDNNGFDEIFQTEIEKNKKVLKR